MLLDLIRSTASIGSTQLSVIVDQLEMNQTLSWLITKSAGKTVTVSQLYSVCANCALFPLSL